MAGTASKTVPGYKMKTPTVLAIIPARGGSKGLPRKNIIDLLGKPLIGWTIDASLKSKYITKTLVSSDDDEILDIAQQYKADILKRPAELALDTTSSEAVVEHVMQELNNQNSVFDYLILLQPTSPLRSFRDIDNAFDILFKSDATSLISVYETDNKLLKAFKQNEDGYIEGVSNNKYPFQRRQDLPKTYMSNGAIYIIKVDEFIKNNSFFTDKTVSYEMSKEKSADIDTLEDIQKIDRI